MIASVLAQVSDDVNVAQNIGFYIIAAGMLVGAIRVVTSSNVVHAALWLVVVLAGVAAQYILAAAEFVAVSQVLVYIGAVMVLFLFGIMLTRAKIGTESNLNNRNWGIGIPVALMLFGLLSWAFIDAYGDDKLPVNGPQSGPAGGPTLTASLSDEVLSPYIVPFLALSFILLAAAIGAIVLARKD
jgi:NADH-quinone oxidoreductase subunit J